MGRHLLPLRTKDCRLSPQQFHFGDGLVALHK
jgi:hypothetical protein